DPESRADLAQEIASQLWRAFPSYDADRLFSTWMYRIALNVAISFYRHENTRTRHIVTGAGELFDFADERASQPEEVRMLYQWIGRLDPMHRALALLYLDGNSYYEIASVLGISETNVATKINRMKQSMRQELGAKPDGTR
ncbi:MAG: RNA polymerase sigma factor, partial [Bryobacteraceae bacterium]